MDLVFEIGTEEIPPLYIRPALAELLASLKAGLEKSGIPYGSLRVLGTPRRLVALGGGIAEKAQDSKQVVFGPPVAAAFDGSGRPTQAAIGFAKSQGVDVARLARGKKGKGEYVCIEKLVEGGHAAELLPAILKMALESLTFPKTMHWEPGNARFARPVRWLVLVLDGKGAGHGERSRFSWAGIEASNVTRGHRFLGSPEIVVTSPEQYVGDLKRNFVIVDHDQRKHLIEQAVAKAAVSVGGQVVKDDDLLERVTFTVECPLAIAGGYSPKFLEMPKEVIVTALREHQEFFSVSDAQGKLVPYFVAVANMDQDREGKIRQGNERVLKARLDDAHFYWEQDAKDGLDAMVERLSHVVWQEQLGTLAEKTGRLVELAAWIAQAIAPAAVETARRAARLSKGDLTSLMVREKEFASLQGVMGREYARVAGEAGEVAQAIFEHYLPRFAGDILPATTTGTVLALADKLDSLVGCFGVGLVPTGSEDPYALRRQATGLVRILLEKGIHLPVSEMVAVATRFYGGKLSVRETDLRQSLSGFIGQRLETLLVEAGNRVDMVKSVLDVDLDDMALATARLEALKKFETDQRFPVFVTAFKRAYNITKGDVSGEVAPHLFQDKAESDLHASYLAILPEFKSLVAEKRFEEAMNLLLGLARPIDTFFTSVMVMAEDEGLKRNRLNLLGTITRRFLEIANFSKMESSS
ncbi:MAG TPA: glycine--tRNA ligase subunit beta [bacterium]|nr:glycine--tRNA ligase subunit beta [bacterium]